MKILVAVPSYNRPYDIMKRTGRWIKRLETDWRVFVEPQQMRYYLQNFTREQLVSTDTGIGVSGQMRHICRYATEHGYDYVFKVDDDMNFKKSGTKVEQSAEIVEEFFSECAKLIEEVGDVGAFIMAKPIEYLHRNGVMWKLRHKTLYGNALAKTEFFDLPEGLKLSADIIVGLNARLSGLPMYTYQFAHEDAIAWTNPGGCQSFDRFKATEEDLRILQERYPLIRQTLNKGRADIDVTAYFD